MMTWGPQDPRIYGDQMVRAVTLPQILFTLNAVFIPQFQQFPLETRDPITLVQQTGSASVNHCSSATTQDHLEATVLYSTLVGFITSKRNRKV